MTLKLNALTRPLKYLLTNLELHIYFIAFRVKLAWVPKMVASITNMLDNWEDKRGEKDELEMQVHKEFHDLSVEILSKTAFESSFEERKVVFEMQEKQLSLAMRASENVYFLEFR